MIDDFPKLILQREKISVTRGQVLDAALKAGAAFGVSGTKLNDEGAVRRQCGFGLSSLGHEVGLH